MKILLLRLRLIGDVMFTTPLIRALQTGVSRRRIAYLVEPEAAPVVAHNPHLDEVIVAPQHARRAADRATMWRWRGGCGGRDSISRSICTAARAARG